jgi:hypothetical protein
MVSEFQRAGFSAFDSPNTLEVYCSRRPPPIPHLTRITDAVSRHPFVHIPPAGWDAGTHVMNPLARRRRVATRDSRENHRHEFAGKNPDRPHLHTLQVRCGVSAQAVAT